MNKEMKREEVRRRRQEAEAVGAAGRGSGGGTGLALARICRVVDEMRSPFSTDYRTSQVKS